MTIKIGSASKDEKGTYRGGVVGDQTGKEIKISYWYDPPWDVYLECTDQTLADQAVQYMKQICGDDHFGYDQSERLTGYNSIIKNCKKVAGASGEFDCSSLVLSCYKLAGLNIDINYYTGNLKKGLLKTGKFKDYTESKYLKDDSYAQAGGIYLQEGKHVVMAVERGKNAKECSVKSDTVSTEDGISIKDDSISEEDEKVGILRLGSKGKQVQALQKNLNDKIGTKLITDGIFGRGTENALKDFQKKFNLVADGIYGMSTHNKMKSIA